MKHVVIIGGGIGGLAAAVRLAGRHRVTLVEKLDRVGGKLNLWQVQHPRRPQDRPFRFDTGPTLLTMPFVLMDLFAAAGEDVRDHLKIVRLDPVARFTWPDGSRFELRDDDLAMHQELSRFAPGDLPGWMKLLNKGRRIWDLGEAFLKHAPDQLVKFNNWRSLAMLAVPFRIGMFSRLSRLIDQKVKNQRLRDVLYQYATYAGTSPFDAPATLAVIPWVEHYFGAWHIEGGMYRLAQQLEMIARKKGTQIRTGMGVDQILIEQSIARGVRLADGTQIPADAVLANSDLIYTYRHLVAPEHRRRYPDRTLINFDPGASGMILMLGTEGTYPQLAHHNKFMPERYRQELRDVFENSMIPGNPCIYVCAPTRTDPSLAPGGCELLFVLVSAPSLRKSALDWSIEGPRYRQRIIQRLEQQCGLNDLSRRIVVEKMISPADFQTMYNSNAGSIYGLVSSSILTAFLRPPNRDRDIRNLYFAGSATHPGGGVPLVALSGKIASELILKDLAIEK